MQEVPVPSLGQEQPLEKGMATHSSILAGTDEPGRPQSMGSQRIGHGWATNTTLASKLQNLGPLNFLDPFLWSVHPRPLLSILHLITKLSEPLGGRIKPGPWTQWCAGRRLTASSLAGEGSPTLHIVQFCGFVFNFFCGKHSHHGKFC